MSAMNSYPYVIQRCRQTGLYVGSVPGLPGAHSQADTLDELQENMREVIAMLQEDSEPALESEFIGVRIVRVG